jgi:hypothetical protein
MRATFQRGSFREAVLWQNRAAFQAGLGWFLRQPDTRSDRRVREKERLLGGFLQRYCVKNDTIGFFGPIGWARLASNGPAIDFRPGPKLTASCQVYFEGGCMDGLANKLGQAEGLKPWLPPRRLPFSYLEGRTLHLPVVATWLREERLPGTVKSVIQLSPAQMCLLELCDGERPARDIAQALLDVPELGVSTEAEVYTLFDQLCDLGVLRWTLEVPLELHPERTLRQRLERVGDESLRRQALAALAELGSAREAVAEAAGDPQALDRTLGDLERTFTRLTGEAPTRASGETYAGRTLVYQDCRRDVTITLGPELVARLGKPLSLLLQSARWFTFQVAQRYRVALGAIYDRLARERCASMVDFYSFSVQALPLLRDPDTPLLTEVMHELQRRWADILSGQTFSVSSPAESQLAYTSQELGPPVQAAFDAPRPGWRLARYCSPDVMIAAASPKAIQRGDFQFVLGEVHLFNTLARSCIVTQHPAPEELFQARERDIPEPCVVPVPSKNWNVQRTPVSLVSPRDIWFEYEATPSGRPWERTVTVGELVVESGDNGLQVRTRDGRLCFDIIEFLGYTLSNQCMAFPSILAPAEHTPRITVDELVICRESWRFRPAELSFARLPDRAEQFLGARRWAREQGLPRWLFVQVPTELKPYYIDLESPIYVEILAKLIRQSQTGPAADAPIRFTEMLPRFDQLWLSDARGERYTSELRFVVLDPVAW